MNTLLRVDRPRDIRRALGITATAVLIGVTAAAYLSDPSGLGLGSVILTMAVLSLAIGLGPLLQRAKPARVWLLVPAGAACFFAGILLPRAGSVDAPLMIGDIVYICGYLCFGSWFIVLTWHVGRGVAARAILDTAAATTGTVLALWAIAGVHDQNTVLPVLRWAVYPLLDVVVIGLASHLAIRLGRVVRAWAWIFGALILQLIVDTAFAYVGLTTNVYNPPILTIGYLLSYAGLALGATHPSVAHLSSIPLIRRDQPQPRRRAFLISLGIFPAVAAMAIPVDDVVDGIARSLLVSLLLVLLFARLLLTTRDLTRARADSAHRAAHDGLTGLLNRASLFEELAQRLREDAVRNTATALLFLDCDDFKHVNDTWGHHAGDVLLRQAAAGLPSCLSPGDILARHGGDEFVVLTRVKRTEEAIEVAERIQNYFSEAFPITAHQDHRLTLSIGIALARPSEHDDPADLLREADIALYEAKARGRARYVLFDDELEERSQTRARIGVALREAIRRDSFTLEFQPIFTGPGYRTTVGWEALVRWTDTEMGPIPPSVFVPLAEELGLIGELGTLVLRRACRELAALRSAMSRHDVIVSVNVSAPQIRQNAFAATVTDALRSAGLTGDSLWLEITETLLVDRNTDVLDTLAEIRATGAQICIDDFGTGYASLATLLRLPVDCVKVDRSIVSRLSEGASAAHQLERLLDLLRSLGITHLVAEGVETAEQEVALQGMGFPMVQGWRYGRAATPAAILSAHLLGGAAAPGPPVA